jgi:hypothetical protein
MNHVVDCGAAAYVSPSLIDTASVVRTSSKVTEVTPRKNIVEFGRDFPKEVNLATNKAGKVSLLIHATNSIKEQVRDGKVLVGPLKRWAYRAGIVANCVLDCHSGDIVQFLDQMPDFTIKQFTCKNGKNHKATFNRKML